MPDYNFMQQMPQYPNGQWGTSAYRNPATYGSSYTNAFAGSVPNAGMADPFGYAPSATDTEIYAKLREFLTSPDYFNPGNGAGSNWRSNVGTSYGGGGTVSAAGGGGGTVSAAGGVKGIGGLPGGQTIVYDPNTGAYPAPPGSVTPPPSTYIPDIGNAPTYTPGPSGYTPSSTDTEMYARLMEFLTNQGYFNPDNWMDPNWRPNVGKSASENVILPLLQFLQNKAQFEKEHAESIRREDAAAAWQRHTDTVGMKLAEAAQRLNEWAATVSAEQWEKQFAFEADKFAQEFGLTKEQAYHAMGLATQKQEFEERAWGEQFGFEKEKWGQQYGLETRKQVVGEQQWAQEHGFEREKWGQQYGLETRKQTAAEEQWAKEHGFEKEKWGQQYGLETSRLAQEKELTERRLASEELQSRYAAFGRAQAPKVQWSRSW